MSLPGMERVRYTDLDAICEGLSDARRKKNQATLDEASYKQDALKSMQKHDVTVYKHSGIGLVRTPGHDVLGVKVLKDGEEGDGGDEIDDLPDAPELDPEAGDVLD
jgi:hypothetical protein